MEIKQRNVTGKKVKRRKQTFEHYPFFGSLLSLLSLSLGTQYWKEASSHSIMFSWRLPRFNHIFRWSQRSERNEILTFQKKFHPPRSTFHSPLFSSPLARRLTFTFANCYPNGFNYGSGPSVDWFIVQLNVIFWFDILPTFPSLSPYSEKLANQEKVSFWLSDREDWRRRTEKDFSLEPFSATPCHYSSISAIHPTVECKLF